MTGIRAFLTPKTLTPGGSNAVPATEWEQQAMSTSKQYVTRALVLGMGLAFAAGAQAQHPGPVPLPMGSSQTQTIDANGVITTTAVTPEGKFPAVNPFENPPGSNFFNTVYQNSFTSSGKEMVNTLPSTPDVGYNLHDGPVTAVAINPKSPFTELDRIIDLLEQKTNANNPGAKAQQHRKEIQKAIDILEGNPIAGAAFSGMPMLHYNGPLKLKKVIPQYDANGNVIGGNVDIRLLYFGQRMESDVALLDPNPVWHVPWTITYKVSILKDGIEDFSPMAMFYDDPRVDSPILDTPGKDNFGMAHIGMDQTYFPMLVEGTEYTVKIKMPPGKYYKLTYNWGWRKHPPRVQVSENVNNYTMGKSLLQHEVDVFGANPRASEAAKLAAIAKIGDLAPEKRMWKTFREWRDAIDSGTYAFDPAQLKVKELRAAFLDFSDRTRLPRGVEHDPEADITLFYVNNTIYGSRHGRNGRGRSGEGSNMGSNTFMGVEANSMTDWEKRPYNFKVTLRNGDHFDHGYLNVDFGGTRGWENQFQVTDPMHAIDPTTGEPYLPFDRGGTDEHLKPTPRVADINARPQFGSGPFFTFGRIHWWMNAGGPFGAIIVPPVAADGTPGTHKVDVTLNFEPSMRLRMYQFDPLHHDVAVYSLH